MVNNSGIEQPQELEISINDSKSPSKKSDKKASLSNKKKANSSLTEDSIKSLNSQSNKIPLPIPPTQPKIEKLKKINEKDTYMSIRQNQLKHKSKKSIKKYSQTQEFKTFPNNQISDQQFLSSPQKKSDSNKKIFSDYHKKTLGSISRTNHIVHKETFDDKINDIFSEIKKKNASNKIIPSHKSSKKNLSSRNLNKISSDKIIPSHKTSKKNVSSDILNKNSSKANSVYIESSVKKIKTLSRNQIVKSISELPAKSTELVPSNNLKVAQASDNQPIIAALSNIDNNSQRFTNFTNTQHDDDSHFVLTNETLKTKDNLYHPKMMTNQSKDNFHKEMTNFIGQKSKSSSSKKQFIPLKRIEDLTPINDLKKLVKKTSESKLIKHNFYKTSQYDKRIKSQRGIIIIGQKKMK